MKKARTNGFTLIEILVATAIMIIMVGLVIQITSSVLNVWNRSVDKLSANAQARIAMELITNDLETAVIRHNGLCWLEAIQEELPSPLDIPTLQTTKLAFFSPAMDRPQFDASDPPIRIGGDVCAISYQLVYQDPVSGDPDPEDNIYALHRRVIDARTTFEDLMGEARQEDDLSSWIDGAVAPTSGHVAPYPEPSDPSYFLASNVIDFRVEFSFVDADGAVGNAATGLEVRYGGTAPTIGPGSGSGRRYFSDSLC